MYPNYNFQQNTYSYPQNPHHYDGGFSQPPMNPSRAYKTTTFKRSEITKGKRKGQLCFTGYNRYVSLFITLYGDGKSVKVHKGKTGEHIVMVCVFKDHRTKIVSKEICLYNKVTGLVNFPDTNRVGNPSTNIVGYSKNGKKLTGYFGTNQRKS